MRILTSVALLCAAVVFGLTLSHVLQAPGSRDLDAAAWLAVQHAFYGGFAIVGGAAEVAGVIAAALTVTLTTLETSCAALGEDVDAYLAALRDQALGEERDSLAVLRELGMDVDAVDPDLDDDDDEDLDDDEEAP